MTPLVLATMAIVTIMLLGVARIGAAADDRARARPRPTRRRSPAQPRAVAWQRGWRRSNGARLVAFHQVGSDAIVTVVVGRMQATSRHGLNRPSYRNRDHRGCVTLRSS